MNRARPVPGLILVVAVAAFGGQRHAAANEPDRDRAPEGDPAAIVAAQLPSYPATGCPVSGKPLGAMGEPANHVSGGRLVRFCCAGCENTFEADAAAYFAKIEAAVVAEQGPRYPLPTCAVDDAALGKGAIDHVDGTKLVRVCSPECREAYARDPAGAMTKVDRAWIGAQLADYPTGECPVMGLPNDTLGDPVDLLWGTRLVRLCCASCVETFRGDPEKFLAKLDESP